MKQAFASLRERNITELLINILFSPDATVYSGFLR